MTIGDPTRPRTGGVLSAPATRRRLRRIVRVSAAAAVPLATALTVGAAPAGAVAMLGGLVWVLWCWPRWEARLFEPSREVELRSQVWAPPAGDPQGARAGLGPPGHRAFARALHALASAYLAECEREADR